MRNPDSFDWGHPALVQLARHVRMRLSGDSTGHDFWHVMRVAQMARRLSEQEGGDVEVLLAAALLHDLFRPEEQRDGLLHFGPEAQARMLDLLKHVGFPPERIDAVLQCVAAHEDYAFAGDARPESLEARLLQDADRLDSIGAIGIARTFMFSGAHGRPMWDPEEAPQHWTARQSPGRSAISHFHEKLLRLTPDLNTSTARAWARARHQFLEEFLGELLAEWDGYPSRRERQPDP